MTIHKAKGLEFNNVFFYWDLSHSPSGSYNKISYYLQYTTNFDRIKDFNVTYNFDQIMQASSRSDLVKQQEIRLNIENINNFYVALTRAKTNLFLYFTFQKKGGIESFLSDQVNESIPTDVVIFKSIINQFNTFQNTSSNNDFISMEIGSWTKESIIKATQAECSINTSYMDLDRLDYITPDEDRYEKERHLNFKTLYLKNKNATKGKIVHYYLSFIKYNTEFERRYGLAKVKQFYGTLINPSSLTALVNKVNNFIDENPDIFSKQYKVFTEHSIFDKDGKEWRIDRLMIDPGKKHIWIIDYKTGDVYEQNQLDQYVKIVESLPYVRSNNYIIDCRYLDIPLS
jgi:ATP-dependent exoDNAse (exonuclease V) beta subunit